MQVLQYSAFRGVSDLILVELVLMKNRKEWKKDGSEGRKEMNSKVERSEGLCFGPVVNRAKLTHINK